MRPSRPCFSSAPAGAAARLCPGVPLGDGRAFACLYARNDRAGQACSSAAQATLKAN
jgi:hypothetical protein